LGVYVELRLLLVVRQAFGWRLLSGYRLALALAITAVLAPAILPAWASARNLLERDSAADHVTNAPAPRHDDDGFAVRHHNGTVGHRLLRKRAPVAHARQLCA
jgi:hypothetical protein